MIEESDNRAGVVGTGVVMSLIGLGGLIAAALTHSPNGESHSAQWCRGVFGSVFLLFGLAFISREGSKFRHLVVLALLGIMFTGFGWVSIFSKAGDWSEVGLSATFFSSDQGMAIRLFMGITSAVALVCFLKIAWNLFRNQPLSGWTTRHGRY